MAKFKIGDKVIIHDGCDIHDFTSGWIGSMEEDVGKIVTIKEIINYTQGRIGYRMEEISCVWDERCLQLAASKNFEYDSPFIIKNYTYNKEKGITTIEWGDGTKTQVKVQYGEKPDAYSGFINACAKKAFGNDNTIKKLYEYWTIKKPKIDAKEEALRREKKRIEENKKRKKAIWLTRKRAIELKREYEARQIAHKKYGVPMDAFNTIHPDDFPVQE